MSYNKAAMQMDHHMFDNVFVNPESYAAFLATGTWPDKTVLVLEGRRAEGKGSINQKGNYQTNDMMGIEAHVKDEARFPGKWAFFAFGDGKTAKMIPTNMECYSCHADHAAVDTTFVQFYPTLLPIAQSKGTLSAAYQKESARRRSSMWGQPPSAVRRAQPGDFQKRSRGLKACPRCLISQRGPRRTALPRNYCDSVLISPRWRLSRHASSRRSARCLCTALPRSARGSRRCAVFVRRWDC